MNDDENSLPHHHLPILSLLANNRYNSTCMQMHETPSLTSKILGRRSNSNFDLNESLMLMENIYAIESGRELNTILNNALSIDRALLLHQQGSLRSILSSNSNNFNQNNNDSDICIATNATTTAPTSQEKESEPDNLDAVHPVKSMSGYDSDSDFSAYSQDTVEFISEKDKTDEQQHEKETNNVNDNSESNEKIFIQPASTPYLTEHLHTQFQSLDHLEQPPSFSLSLSSPSTLFSSSSSTSATTSASSSTSSASESIFTPSWLSKVKELKRLYSNLPHKHGEAHKILSSVEEYKKMYNWLRNERKQYSLFKNGLSSTMTSEKIMFIESQISGFNWREEYRYVYDMQFDRLSYSK